MWQTPKPKSQVYISSGRAFNHSFMEDNSIVSSWSVDTDFLSLPDSNASTSSTSRTLGPNTFSVSQLDFDAKLKVQRSNAAFRENIKVFISDLKLKSYILLGVLQDIVKHKVFVTDRQFCIVGVAFISKYPCLAERGSVIGYADGKASFMEIITIKHTHLKKLGCHRFQSTLLSKSLKANPVLPLPSKDQDVLK